MLGGGDGTPNPDQLSDKSYGFITADANNMNDYKDNTLEVGKNYFVLDGNPRKVEAQTEGFSAFVDSSTRAVVYYMYPHYDNTVASHLRFPHFYDLDGTTSMHALDNEAGHLRKNMKHREFLMNVDSTDGIKDDGIVGLGLYVHFQEQSITTPLRVDYYHSNQFPLLFEQGRGTEALPNQFKGTALRPKSVAKVKECCTPCSSRACETETKTAQLPKRTVVVTDLTSKRVWDTKFHGREKHYLGSKSSTGSNVGSAQLSACSKRGLCDYSSGLCSCFAGYAGDNCANVVAIA